VVHDLQTKGPITENKMRDFKLLEHISACCDICNPHSWLEGSFKFYRGQDNDQSDLDRVLRNVKKILFCNLTPFFENIGYLFHL
jgi:hypothetical protein